MLHYLRIRDFVLVESLDWSLQQGFTVLTGETGAGKSILIDALGLVLGARADMSVIRTGAKQAVIEADLDASPALQEWLQENGIENADDPSLCLLRRIIDGGGRSRGFINGYSATLVQLRAASSYLLDIHGQHDNQNLLRTEMQRGLLDEQGGLGESTAAVAKAWQERNHCQQALATANTRRLELEEERSRWELRFHELQRVSPTAGEWEGLEQEHRRLSHAAGLIQGSERVLGLLEGSEEGGMPQEGIISRLSEISDILNPLQDLDQQLSGITGLLEGAQVQVEEAVHDLRRYLRHNGIDDKRLAEVDLRMGELHGLARRLRLTPEELPSALQEAEERLQSLAGSLDLELLQEALKKAEADYQIAAQHLSVERRKVALDLAPKIETVLRTLGMPKSQFAIALTHLEEGNQYGQERVEFLFAGHAGSSPASLSKVASGGELSRVSLAIRVVASRAGQVPSLIFDEVDAGIGGATAEVVGRLLRTLGTERQVLCVTHLA